MPMYDPRREHDPHARNVEVFFVPARTFVFAAEGTWQWERMDGETPSSTLEGWYWWSCQPGCLPDGDPSGPFATEALALADARDIITPDDDDRPAHLVLKDDRERHRRGP